MKKAVGAGIAETEAQGVRLGGRHATRSRRSPPSRCERWTS